MSTTGLECTVWMKQRLSLVLRPTHIWMVLTGVLAATGLAQAEETAAEEPLRLTYDAPASCPTRADFMNQVRARTDRVAFVATPSARRLVVSVAGAANGFDGSLQIATKGQSTSTRRFSDPNCAEVVSALALAAAVAVDPNAKTGALPVSSDPAPSAVGRLPATAPRIAKPADASDTQRIASSVPAPTPSPPPPRARPRDDRPPPEAHIEAGLALRVGVLPTVLIGAQLASSLSSPGLPWLERFRFSGAYARSSILTPDDDAADYQWFDVRLDWCPWTPRTSANVSLEICAAPGVAAVRASGKAPDITADSDTAWIPTMSLVGGARSTLIGPLFLGVRALVGVHFLRDTFVFESPRRVVHPIPAVSGGFDLSFGVQFL